MDLLKKIFYVGRVADPPKALVGFCALFLMISAVSCSRAPEDPAWFQSSTSGDSLTSGQLAEKINNVDSLFKMYEMKREYILRSGESRKVMIMLDKRRDQLAEDIEVFSAIPDKLNFLDWDIQKLGDKDNKYRISCYFVVTDKMDRDWNFKLIGKVDEKHSIMLPPENRKYRSVNWRVYPKTSTWDKGEHKIISKIVVLQPIPYNIGAVFSLYPEQKYGKAFNYGWFADVDAEPASHPQK